MTTSRLIRSILVISLCLFTVAASAAERRRPTARETGINLTGTLTDAVSGAPIFHARVLVMRQKVAVTNEEGKIWVKNLLPGPAQVEFSRWGYETLVVDVVLVPGNNVVNVKLRSKPVINVTTTSGATFVADYESAEFKSFYPLAAPTTIQLVPFCRANGTEVSVRKNDVAIVTGSGSRAAAGNCCSGVALPRFTLSFRNGESFDAFVQECRFYRLLFVAQDMRDGSVHYLNLTEIARIEFPR